MNLWKVSRLLQKHEIDQDSSDCSNYVRRQGTKRLLYHFSIAALFLVELYQSKDVLNKT